MSYLVPIALMALAACNVAPNRSEGQRSAPAPTSQPASQPESPSRSRSAPQPVRDCTSGVLELTLTPSRPDIRLGEPAVIMISLRNCGNAVADVPADIETEYQSLRLLIRTPEGESFPYEAPVQRETRRRLTVALPPRTALGSVAHVYFHRTRRWLLNVPGVFRVHGRLSTEKTVIEAAATAIIVQPAPAGISREDLAGLWPTLGRALYLGEAGDTKAARAWSGWSKPASAYLRPYLRVAEVLVQSEQQYDASANKFVMPQCSEAAADGPRIVKAVPDPYFSAVAASRLNRCLTLLDKAAAGRALIDQARAAHPRLATHPAMGNLLSDEGSSRR